MSGVTTQKTRIFHDDGAAGWTFIPNATTIPFPESSPSNIDVTNLESGAKEYIKGLSDLGTISLEINLDTTKTQHQNLFALDQSGEAKEWRIEFPENNATTCTSVTFSGYVDSISGSHSVDDKQSRTIAIKINGDYAILFAQTREVIA